MFLANFKQKITPQATVIWLKVSLFLYNLFIQLYNLLAHFLKILKHKKATLWVQGRQNWQQQLSQQLQNNNEVRIWMHCASLGEYEQGKPVIEAIQNTFPAFKIVITFFSPSGYEVSKNNSSADYLFYLPIDTATNAQTFIKAIKPSIAIFIKYEFWYHYLNTLHQQNIPTILISAIFKPEQVFFKPYGILMKQMLQKFTHLFVQNQESVNLLHTIGIENITQANDTRFDRVFTRAVNVKSIPIIEQFKAQRKLLLAGSTWYPDEKLLAAAINNLPTNICVIFAPHELNENTIKKLQNILPTQSILLSQITENTPNLANTKILIIDSMNILANAYQYADIAYIGGGFGAGIHNILEAAAFGVPIIFGTNYQKFNEAVQLIEKGGAFSIKNENEFLQVFNKILPDCNQIGYRNKQFVAQNIGGTDIVINYIKTTFSKMMFRFIMGGGGK